LKKLWHPELKFIAVRACAGLSGFCFSGFNEQHSAKEHSKSDGNEQPDRIADKVGDLLYLCAE